MSTASNLPKRLPTSYICPPAALGYLEPCGLNTPHTHPRATEINIAINGTLRTGMLAENGARFVFNDVPPGSVTVFPQGAIHFEMNLGCGEFSELPVPLRSIANQVSRGCRTDDICCRF
jgi:oxalate decarboxylase/phosphoglucose isomerase-like protein (cupin superfamily)